ncbi:MAG: DNA-3-methyladenine glycosylase [Candidatus Paceibacterota bacterium]
MKKRLFRDFYTRDTLEVARDLLGKYIIRNTKKGKIIGQIIETEAYIGPKDRASHAYLGKLTPRNEAEFLIGGHIYIYLVYGLYWQLNISTNLEGKPECVLIRALKPIQHFQKTKEDINFTNGPGKVCSFLEVDKSFYKEDLVTSKRIYLEDWGEKIDPKKIMATKRVGIEYAGKYWANRKWRFLLKDFYDKLKKVD